MIKKVDAARAFAGGPVCRLEAIEVIRANDIHVDANSVARAVQGPEIGAREFEVEGWFYRAHYGRYKNDFDGGANEDSRGS